MANWFYDAGCPLVVAANKLDKLKKSEIAPNLELIRQTLDLREGDVLLLAGKGHETYQEVKGEKRHMDERELVAAYFS